MHKRPKDMTDEELQAIPVVDRWSEKLIAAYWQGDDIMAARIGADTYSFAQRPDESWVRFPAAF